MKQRTKNIIGLFSILVFVLSVSISPLNAQANDSGNISYENDSIVLSIKIGELII